MSRQTNIQIRRGTAADWASVNPTLSAGEPGLESDTRKLKLGDGTTAWNSLQYVKVDGGSLDSEGATTTTTTTATPTTTTTTATPTTTTTTAAPNGVFSLSGAGDSSANGCYVESGSTDDFGTPVPSYTNGTYWVWYQTMSAPPWRLTQTKGSGQIIYWLYGAANPTTSGGEWKGAEFEAYGATGASPTPTQTMGC